MPTETRRGPKPLSREAREKRNNEIATKYERGVRSADLAEAYGLSQPMIWRILRKEGVDTRGNVGVRPNRRARLNRVKEMRHHGYTLKEMAAKEKVSTGTISLDIRWLREQGEVQ